MALLSERYWSSQNFSACLLYAAQNWHRTGCPVNIYSIEQANRLRVFGLFFQCSPRPLEFATTKHALPHPGTSTACHVRWNKANLLGLAFRAYSDPCRPRLLSCLSTSSPKKQKLPTDQMTWTGRLPCFHSSPCHGDDLFLMLSTPAHVTFFLGNLPRILPSPTQEISCPCLAFHSALCFSPTWLTPQGNASFFFFLAYLVSGWGGENGTEDPKWALWKK